MAKLKVTQEQVLAALRETRGMIFLAAKRLGVNRKTVQRYLERWHQAREIVSQSRGELVDTAEHKLWEAVDRGEQWAIRMILQTQGRDRGYGPQLEVDHKGKIDIGFDITQQLLADPEAADIASELLARLAIGAGHADGSGVGGQQPPVDPGQAPHAD